MWLATHTPPCFYNPVFTRLALPGSMLFKRHAGASRNQRAFRKYFSLIWSCHTARNSTSRTYVRLFQDCGACIFCDTQYTMGCEWENLNSLRGGPCHFFHSKQEMRAVLAGGDSFDTVTDNVQNKRERDPQSLAYGAFIVEVETHDDWADHVVAEVETHGRDCIFSCDGCTQQSLRTPVVTEDSMRVNNTHTLQLLRNFWERGIYADVRVVA